MTGTTRFDPAQYKANIRTEWRAAAPGWSAWVGVLEAEDGGGAVSRTLVQLARIGPGDVVLDVAAGYGEPGLTAARAVAPGGRVVCTDISGEMLVFGRERAAAEGLDNVEFLECDAEELVFEEASFDAVLSRQGLQFLPDVAGVLARLRAFLKPHGRLAAAVWGPPDTVQFAAPVPVIRAELGLPPPPAGIPGPFALADAGQLARLVEAAGFTDVETGTVTAIYQTDSPELATRWLREVAPPISSLVDGRPPEVQERVWAKVTQAWAPYTTADGRVRLENQAVWVTGTRYDIGSLGAGQSRLKQTRAHASSTKAKNRSEPDPSEPPGAGSTEHPEARNAPNHGRLRRRDGLGGLITSTSAQHDMLTSGTSWVALQGPPQVCRAAGTPQASTLRGLEPAAEHRPDSLDKSP